MTGSVMLPVVIEGTSRFLRVPPYACHLWSSKESQSSFDDHRRHVVCGNLILSGEMPRSGDLRAKARAHRTKPRDDRRLCDR